MRRKNLISIVLLSILISSCNDCQKLKNYIETDYTLVYVGYDLDTLGILTLKQNTYTFKFNPSFPDSLKKFAPPFIFTKPHGLYKWFSEDENTCIDDLDFYNMPIQKLEFDPFRTKPSKENRIDLFEDNMNHRFGISFFKDSIISMQMGVISYPLDCSV